MSSAPTSHAPWQVGLFARPHQVPTGRWQDILYVARVADELGFHSIHFGDHLVIGPDTDRYPYGEFRHEPDVPWPDPITTLASVAAVTTRLRLGTSVLLLPMRNAISVAKSVATLDALSGGRVDLGVGVGWQAADFAAAGVPWNERHDRFDESIRACRAIWGEQPVSFSGRWIELDQVYVFPRPVQDRLPLMYGVAMTEANAEHIAAWGDGWCPVGLSNDQLASGIDLLRRTCESRGRDPDSMTIRARPDQIVDAAGRIDLVRAVEGARVQRELGVNLTTIGPLAGYSSLPELEDALGTLAQLTRTD